MTRSRALIGKILSHAADQRSTSLWMDVDVAPDARPLRGNQQCDVLVVGSGMAGISTAYELAARGERVIVAERGRICGGITARTSAHWRRYAMT